MKKNRIDLQQPMLRLMKYYSYFSNKDYILDEDIEEGCSISGISSHLGIPVSVVRRDIAGIVEMPENGYILFDMKDEEEDDTDAFSRRDICKEIITGAWDHVPIISVLPFSFTNADLPMAMKENEAELLGIYTKNCSMDIPGMDGGYRIKSNYRFQYTEALTEKIFALNEAIDSSCAVRLRYHDPEEKKEANHEIYPVQLLFDSTDNIYALVAAGNEFRHLNTYRLDRMIYLSVNRRKTWDPTEEKYKSLLENLKYAPIIWDMNYDEVRPVHVKVCFQNVGNVWEKVKQDLAYRINGTLREMKADVFGEKETVLVYEDDVSGKKNFESWVLGYGRSAYIQEPEEFRDDIVATLKLRMKKYT